MDFGCGTGLIALPLAAHLKQITAIDSAEHMLAVCTQKCIAQGINTISCHASLQRQGFTVITLKTAHTIDKQIDSGVTQTYPIFFLVAQKLENI